MSRSAAANAAAASTAAATTNAASSPAPPPLLPASPAVVSFLRHLNSSLPAPLSALTLSYFFAGAGARLTSSVIVAPLDAVKTRVQFAAQQARTQTDGKPIKGFAGGWSAARSMYAAEGVPAFFRGLPARLAYVGPSAAISFIFYEQFRALYHFDASQHAAKSKTALGGSLYIVLPVVLAIAARVAGSAIRTPFDVVKQRMQVQGALAGYAAEVSRPVADRAHGIYRHSGEALGQITRKEGARTLFSGLGATLFRDLPFAVVYFSSYEWSKDLQQRVMARRPAAQTVKLSSEESRAAGLSAPRYLLSGAFAAACAVLVTMPADVVKTQLQTQGSIAALNIHRPQGVAACVRHIWATEGAKGFFRGVGPRLVYLTPASAITWTLYENYKRAIQRVMKLEDTPYA